MSQIKQEHKYKYNLKIQRNDTLEHPLLKLKINLNLPPIVDLRKNFPKPFDQETLGSCTANALCGLVSYADPNLIGSRLFLYYNERKLEDNISEDNGAQLCNGVKCLLDYGICQETEWPYIISKFAIEPPKSCYQNSLKHKALKVQHINNDMYSMKNSLSSGFPFVVGIMVYDSFETEVVKLTGYVTMPSSNDTELGGHAVVCVGYNNTEKVWIMRNSWGTTWGDNGYFYLPYPYLTNPKLSTDLWSITKFEV
jgi:C1A family cysteine protease